ncbi:hypothetical protein [Amycolatopsis kentuckyensis]|uniref:hypothetical protein n=1 Tax=Amycolatopsis kentuckyensis TaxID=218823 RepID=UPI000A37AA19|nr:hypothetical protein [Amycolatopsis kentuckyensis]
MTNEQQLNVDIRQKLRDYAREDAKATVRVSTRSTAEIVVGQRGEMAGKVFVALQNVLDRLPEIEEVNGVPHVAGKIRDEIAKALA